MTSTAANRGARLHVASDRELYQPRVPMRGKKPGRRRTLAPWKQAFIRKAVRLRALLTNEALAKRFGVSKSMISDYACGAHKDWP